MKGLFTNNLLKLSQTKDQLDWIKNKDNEDEVVDTGYFSRYLSIEKFINLIVNNHLRFSRFDMFDDPIEGGTQVNIQDIVTFKDQSFNVEEYNQNIALEIIEGYIKNAKSSLEKAKEELEIAQSNGYGLCLYYNENGISESRIMWNLYSNPIGVVMYIPALYLDNLLRKRITYPEFIAQGYYGRANYEDIFSTEFFAKESDSKTRFFTKDKSYEHEREYRYVLATEETIENTTGIYARLPDNTIIDFCAHPDMPNHIFNDLKSILKKYSPKSTFNRSKLFGRSVFGNLK